MKRYLLTFISRCIYNFYHHDIFQFNQLFLSFKKVHQFSKPAEKCNVTNPKPKPNANSHPLKTIDPNKVEMPRRKKNGKRDFRYSENRRFLVDPDGVYRNLGSPDKRYKENKNPTNLQ